MGKVDSLKICGKCGAHCCSYGGTTATKEEVDRIIKAGNKDYFEKITDNAYITRWGKEGICPYLKNNACSIHSIRPLLCRTFPALKFIEDGKKQFFIQKCPLQEKLSKKELGESFKLLKEIPDELLIAANKYLDPFGKILEKRLSKYEIVKVKK